MTAPRTDQRREIRHAATGVVRVRCSSPEAKKIEGRLIDISASGFRMAHRDVSLQAGQVVEFSHHTAAGTARVMWNRIFEENVESGFFVLARE